MDEYVSIEAEGDKISLIRTNKPEPKSVEKSIEEKINGFCKKQLKELNECQSNLKK